MDSLGELLYRLTVLLRLSRHNIRDKHDLSEREILLLFLLRFYHGSPVNNLAAHLDVPNPTLSNYLKHLSENKYIKRSLDTKDTRIHRVYLSQKGRKLIDRLELSRGERYDSFIDEGLKPSEDQRRLLTGLINQAIELLEPTVEQMLRRLPALETRAEEKNTKREEESHDDQAGSVET